MSEQDSERPVVLVTGANGGIGRSVCARFVRSGAQVFRTDVAGTEDDGIIVGDMLDADFPRRCLEQVIDDAGRIDVLVNCAGICPRTSLPDIGRDEWDRVMAINLAAVFAISQACIDIMIRQGSGAIINISSLAAKVGGIAVGAHYSASKAAMICLTKTLARHGAPHGVRVNAVAPGIIDTAMTRDAGAAEQDRLKTQIPMGRFGSPEEVAGAIFFLASPDASYITGATIDVNGGVLMD